MSFQPTEEQIAFRDTARSFAAERMAPHAADWDREKIFPTDVSIHWEEKLGKRSARSDMEYFANNAGTPVLYFSRSIARQPMSRRQKPSGHLIRSTA